MEEGAASGNTRCDVQQGRNDRHPGRGPHVLGHVGVLASSGVWRAGLGPDTGRWVIWKRSGRSPSDNRLSWGALSGQFALALGVLIRGSASDDLEGAAVCGFLVAVGEGKRAGLVGLGVRFGEFAL